MTQDIDWFQLQTKTSHPHATPKRNISTAMGPTPEAARAHFRAVGKTLVEYNYEALVLSPTGVSPAPYELQVTRTHVILSESTAEGVRQTRLRLSDGALLRGDHPADDRVFAHFLGMVHQVQAALEKNEITINTQRDGEM